MLNGFVLTPKAHSALFGGLITVSVLGADPDNFGEAFGLAVVGAYAIMGTSLGLGIMTAGLLVNHKGWKKALLIFGGVLSIESNFIDKELKEKLPFLSAQDLGEFTKLAFQKMKNREVIFTGKNVEGLEIVEIRIRPEEVNDLLGYGDYTSDEIAQVNLVLN